jgi:hypothetical protein
LPRSELDIFGRGAEIEAVNDRGYTGKISATVIRGSREDLENLKRIIDASKRGSSGRRCERDWPQHDSGFDQRTEERCTAWHDDTLCRYRWSHRETIHHGRGVISEAR